MRLSSAPFMRPLDCVWRRPRRRRSAPRRPRRRNLRLEQLESRLALAATPQLVRDINPGTVPFDLNLDSDIHKFTVVGSTLYFSTMTDVSSGIELCKLDDTTGNVVRVKDIWPGFGSSEPKSLTVVGSTLYFTANDGVTGRELWKTDGTESGTVRIKDIRAGRSGSSPEGLNGIGSTLYFTADDGVTGRELWKTDGTESGTVRVRDIAEGVTGSEPVLLAAIGTTVYFTADDGVTGRELWKTDGTEGGTVRVKDIRADGYGADPRYLATFGSTLYFEVDDGVTGRVPWKTDGSADGTVPVEDPWEKFIAANAANFRAVGSMFYYTVGDTFWKTDGSEQVDTVVKTFQKEFPWSTSLSNLTAVGSTLYFTAYTTSAFFDSRSPVSELWKSDGTPDGTVRLGPADGWRSIFDLTAVGSTLYFRAVDGVSGDELWKTDGTKAGTVRVKDIAAGADDSNPSHLTAIGSTLYFTANDGVNGEQFWKTDGTKEGTVRVTDLKRGANSSEKYGLFLSSFGSMLYFTADDGVTGPELWKTDGTRDGTVRVKDIRPGAAGSESIPLAAVDATLYFAAIVEENDADDTTRVELWKTDGTEAGTVRVKPGILISDEGNDSDYFNLDNLFTAIGSTLYFTATDGTTGSEFWKTDGTDAGTVRVKDINAGPSGSEPGSLTVVGSTVYFTADDGVTGRELWKTDGTPAGTVRVKDIRVGKYDSEPEGLIAVGSTLYFTADDGDLGSVLWKSDGTEAGTVPVTVTLNGETYNFKPSGFVAVGSTLYFYFKDDRDLWKTDGTAAGTVKVKAGITSSYLFTTVVGSTLYFATGNDESAELWKTDGTAAGTVLIKGGEAGRSGPLPYGMTAVGPTLYFTFYDAAQGFQFWKTDGTQTGTVHVADLGGDTFPGVLSRFHGSTLFFSGIDMAHGAELWSLSLNSPENSQPTDITLSRATVAENQAAGAIVGTLSTTDPDAGDTFTYSLVAGPGAADNGSFRIDGGTLRTAARFNFEAKRTYSVRVRSTDQDGFWTEKVFTINVTDVAEPLVVESVTLPTGDSYKAGERLTFVMNLSLPATVKGAPQLQFKVGSTMRVATYVGGSGTTRLEFRYTVRPNDYAETVSLGARFAPSFAGLGITAGTRRLAAVLPAGVAGAVATGVRIDAVPPRTVGRVTGPAAGAYQVGQALTFVVTFSEKVFVWGAGGAWITLTGITGGPMQALPRQAAYVSGSGTNQLTFRYVVQDGDTIAPGKVLTLGNRITLGAGTRIVDRDGKNDALLSISPPSLAKVRLAAALPTSRKSAFAALGRSA